MKMNKVTETKWWEINVQLVQWIVLSFPQHVFHSFFLERHFTDWIDKNNTQLYNQNVLLYFTASFSNEKWHLLWLWCPCNVHDIFNVHTHCEIKQPSQRELITNPICTLMTVGVSPDRTSKQRVTFVKGFFLGSGVIYATPWLLIGQGLQRYVQVTPPSPHIPLSPFTHPSYLLNAWCIWVCRAQASLKGFEGTDC